MNPNLVKVVIDYLTLPLPFEQELLSEIQHLKWDFDDFQYNPNYIRSSKTLNRIGSARYLNKKWKISHLEHLNFKWGVFLDI